MSSPAHGACACHVRLDGGIATSARPTLQPCLPGATGTIGPNLTGIGDPQKRAQLAGDMPNTPDNLKRWIQNPGTIKPGTMMPNLNLSEKDADDLVALLVTLR